METCLAHICYALVRTEKERMLLRFALAHCIALQSQRVYTPSLLCGGGHAAQSGTTASSSLLLLELYLMVHVCTCAGACKHACMCINTLTVAQPRAREVGWVCGFVCTCDRHGGAHVSSI